MNASAQIVEPVSSVLPLSPRWEEEKAPLPPPTTRLALNLRLKALRERLALLDARHAETMAALEQREADVEAFGGPALVEDEPAPKAHRRPGPIFEGASWTAEHGIDWLREAKAAREAFYAGIDEETWVSVEAAREIGPEGVAELDQAGRRRKPAPAPEVAPAVEPAVEPGGQLLLFFNAPAPTRPEMPKPRRRRREVKPAQDRRPKAPRSRVPDCQLALLDPPRGPPHPLRLNLLRAA